MTKSTILLVGMVGSGKTNTLNKLAGTDYPVSDSFSGTTTSFQVGCRNGHTIIDTPGLSDSSRGIDCTSKGFLKLVEFVTSNIFPGISAVVMITDKPRVSESLQNNYMACIDLLFQRQLPCFLFVNKQELTDYQNQYNTNLEVYERAGFRFKDGAAGGFKMNDAEAWSTQWFDRILEELGPPLKGIINPHGVRRALEQQLRYQQELATQPSSIAQMESNLATTTPHNHSYDNHSTGSWLSRLLCWRPHSPEPSSRDAAAEKVFRQPRSLRSTIDTTAQSAGERIDNDLANDVAQEWWPA